MMTMLDNSWLHYCHKTKILWQQFSWKYEWEMNIYYCFVSSFQNLACIKLLSFYLIWHSSTTSPIYEFLYEQLRWLAICKSSLSSWLKDNHLLTEMFLGFEADNHYWKPWNIVTFPVILDSRSDEAFSTWLWTTRRIVSSTKNVICRALRGSWLSLAVH